MTRAGVFDNLGERNQILLNLEKLLDWSKKNQKMKESGQRGLFDNSTSVSFSNGITMDSAEAMSDYDKLTWEKELLGLYISGHPLEKYRGMLEQQAMPIKKISRRLERQRGLKSKPF